MEKEPELKVFGITYSHTRNYGSFFQELALQNEMEKIRVDNIACRYRIISIKYYIPHIAAKFSSARKKLVILLFKICCKRFSNYENRTICFVNVKSRQELEGLNSEADAFVCGSDVIWNVRLNSYIGAYYLDFARKHKFSYAASFGRQSLPEDEKIRIKPMLESLDAISVREETGAEFVREITGRSAFVAADPVLLLTREEWEQLVAIPEKQKQKYIFVYTTYNDSTLDKFVSALSRKTGLKVIHTSWVKSTRDVIKSGFFVKTPPEWLGLLRDAEYVVTNSFHGTLFSTIFKKRFFTVVWGGKMSGTNIRIYDFITSVGLESRLYNCVPGIIDTGDIDFSQADKVIKQKREESVKFLHDNLKAALEKRKSIE